MKTKKIRSRLYEILEKQDGKDKLGIYSDLFLIILIILNIIAVLLETVDSIYSAYKLQFI